VLCITWITATATLCSFLFLFRRSTVAGMRTGSGVLPKFSSEQILDFPLFCAHYFRQAFEHLLTPLCNSAG